MKKILTIVLIVAVAVGGYFGYTHFFGDNAIQTVTGADGTKYKVDEQVVKGNTGFAKSDEKGELTPLQDNDADCTSIASVVMSWADLTGNRSYENITGDEEYGLYSDDFREYLINDLDDINVTKNGYISNETATKTFNIKATNIVLLPDHRAYAVVENDSTLLHSTDVDGSKNVGFSGIGSTKHDIVEFELTKDSNGDWKITAVKTISDWTK